MRSILASLALSIALFGAGTAPAGAATTAAARSRYVYRTVSIPGEANTYIWGINAHGAYVGQACNLACTKKIAFVSTGGRITDFKVHFKGYDASDFFTPDAIDDAGSIAGTYLDDKEVFHGFLRRPSGALEEINVPQAPEGKLEGTVVETISPDGVIVGWYTAKNGAQRGFIDRKGHYRSYSDPDGVDTEITFYLHGEFGGVFFGANGAEHGFYVSHGLAHTVNGPRLLPASGAGSLLVAVSANGTLYGNVDRPGDEPVDGFADHDGVFTTIRDPHQVGTHSFDGTYVSSANAAGDVVGIYSSDRGDKATGARHKGFIAHLRR